MPDGGAPRRPPQPAPVMVAQKNIIFLLSAAGKNISNGCVRRAAAAATKTALWWRQWRIWRCDAGDMTAASAGASLVPSLRSGHHLSVAAVGPPLLWTVSNK